MLKEMQQMETLAINGGKPQINYVLPDINDVSGRGIGSEEKKLVMEVLDSGSLGLLAGTKVRKFQNDWAAKFGVKTAVATSSGTAAIHTALIFIGVGPGDEVLVPPITDMGTVIAILLQNAIPVFVDVDVHTQNMDPCDMERKITERTKAVLPVHMFGYPCDMDSITAIARKHGIYIIEDCCQAHLTEYKGRYVGTFGDAAAFSFQQTKHITTGEGGMVITNEDAICGRKLLLCADKGWPREKYRDHLFLAPNYHMTDLQAAVGIAQLRKIDRHNENRRKSAQVLTSVIGGIDGVQAPLDGPEAKHTYFAYSFTIDPAVFTADNKQLARAISAEGVKMLPSYLPQPLYLYDFLLNQKTYGNTHCPFDCENYKTNMDYRNVSCPNAVEACKRGMFMLWNEKMTEENANDIGNAIRKVLQYYMK
jgi:perosamine synthetase